jgi:O-antigen/teichoic acid export membrane protein
MLKKPLRKHAHHVDNKLKFRLRLYVIISLVMLGVVLYEIFIHILPLEFAAVGILVGLVVGIISARRYHLSWDKDAKKIVSRLDLIGIIILVLYIGFVIVRSKLIGIFVQGPVVGAVSFSITAGVMIGRVVGTRNAIIEILREREII